MPGPGESRHRHDMNALRHPALKLLNLPALLAILLLATLPTLGRLQATPMPGMHAGTTAMCTVDGLRTLRSDLLQGQDATHPVAPAHQHDDCAYCPLLAGLAQLPVALMPHLLPPGSVAQTQVHSTARITSIADTGLGARGPPGAIASITT